ncbi:uncharacterized protein Z520_03157 [Fonsecaea multimorphosa CBS 102226]|uniref:DUF7580 domain-containing protein n=1 Tax=Fonsecaea multimorphosa CBS 102226 TaxID=1442371 RepID=A0A0D2KE54_9EURO|nr:uncharacterized protein Z520_03157 [Fonsecaea multimorphosa CBS 102226]KIY01605.1 hypothetical protein Z520_03157 [Fonsecaea multimorphosa CBS 102226]OAL28116.1 hypothetical protein AYO22_03143 [Fonsecaea multimorphosa]
MSGFEIAGIVLGALPIVVSLIGEYREGVGTIKILVSTRRYQREVRRYQDGLSTETTIFQNNLERVLLQIVHDEEDIATLLQNPDGDLWKRSEYDAALQKMMKTSYGAYMVTMSELSDMLKNLKEKLGTHSAPSNAVPNFKRFTDVLSKKVYEALLGKIRSANQTLSTITEQVHKLAESRKSRWPNRGLLQDYTKIRRHARSVYETFVCGNCWSCPCKAKHVLQLRLENPPSKCRGGGSRCTQTKSKFVVHRFSYQEGSEVGVLMAGEEVEIEAADLQDDADSATSRIFLQTQLSQASRINESKGVRFGIVKPVLETIPWPKQGNPGQQLQDVCNALKLCSQEGSRREHIGFLTDVLNRRRHDIYIVRKLPTDQSTRSIKSILEDHSLSPRVGDILLPPISQRNSRHLAAILASCVFQLHGNWLESLWGLENILLPSQSDYYSNHMSSLPYLSRALVQAALKAGTQSGSEWSSHPLIRSKILFPLGLALVELSLGQPLEALYEPKDHDESEAVAKLKTALRLLDFVQDRNGDRYCNVVKVCLLWAGPDGDELDNKGLQSVVFEKVVMPLQDDLDDFEGNSFVR